MHSSAEQQARDLLVRMGLDAARDLPASSLIELANLIAENARLKSPASTPSSSENEYLDGWRLVSEGEINLPQQARLEHPRFGGYVLPRQAAEELMAALAHSALPKMVTDCWRIYRAPAAAGGGQWGVVENRFHGVRRYFPIDAAWEILCGMRGGAPRPQSSIGEDVRWDAPESLEDIAPIVQRSLEQDFREVLAGRLPSSAKAWLTWATASAARAVKSLFDAFFHGVSTYGVVFPEALDAALQHELNGAEREDLEEGHRAEIACQIAAVRRRLEGLAASLGILAAERAGAVSSLEKALMPGETLTKDLVAEIRQMAARGTQYQSAWAQIAAVLAEAGINLARREK